MRLVFYVLILSLMLVACDAKKEEYIDAASNLGYGRLAKFIADIALAGGGFGVSDYY